MAKRNKKGIQIFLSALLLVISICMLNFVNHVETIMAAEKQAVEREEVPDAVMIAYEIPIEEIKKICEDESEQENVTHEDSVRLGAKTSDFMSTQTDRYRYMCGAAIVVILLTGNGFKRQRYRRERR